jgi:hypothetical protein
MTKGFVDNLVEPHTSDVRVAESFEMDKNNLLRLTADVVLSDISKFDPKFV